MPSPAKLLASASGASVDPNFRNVTLLLHGDGSNGAQNNTFIDSSTNNFTITRNGNTTQGSFSPYGSRWSNYFDGSGDYLTISSGAAFGYATGDFTIEFWIYLTGTQDQTIISNLTSASSTNPHIYYSAGTIRYYTASADRITSGSISLNQWYHVALTRASGSTKMFVNGVQAGSTYADSNNYGTTAPLGIATYWSGGSPVTTNTFTGYMSNVRIVKGTAVYTAAFTPPAAPLTAISGTSLLTCQSNRILDASTNNFAITRNGDVAVSPFSPYAPTAPYSAATNGGSVLFDGSSDYLVVASNSAFALGSGDFTLECWVYNRIVSDYIGYLGVWGGTGGSYILYREATAWKFYYSGPTGSPLSPSIPAVANTWTHLAVVRNGSTLTFYIDGVVGASANIGTTAFSSSTSDFYIGANQANPSSGLNGYMAGARLVKGSAVYTAAFTPPTAPPTAISGTSFLLQGTNAGIVDSSADNDLETVGNAQISTSVKKFGTGSMSFNGSTDWLVTPNKPEHNFGTGDFTIEAWAYPTGTNSQATIISNYNGPSSGWGLLLGSTGPTFGWGDTNLLAGSSALTQNAWNHVAITRSGTSLRMFLNGTQIASATNSTDFTSTGALFIGRLREATAGFYWQGYLDDVRLTKGVARYTANFTPPTAAFPDQ